MKVIHRTIWKVLPGKMAEAVELEKKELAKWSHTAGSLPAVKRYRPLIGGGDPLRTVIWQQEWDSLAEWEASFKKAAATRDMSELATQWANVLEDYQVEFYIETSQE